LYFNGQNNGPPGKIVPESRFWKDDQNIGFLILRNGVNEKMPPDDSSKKCSWNPQPNNVLSLLLLSGCLFLQNQGFSMIL